jgi:HAD superfamily hydrolase (TIGR01549 family)
MTIKAIIFDFDGVIVESMDIKTKAFEYIFGNQPKNIIEQIVKLHLDNGGMSRFEKFRIIYKDFLKKNLSESEEKRLGREFNKFVYEEMMECSFVIGAKEFLEDNYKKYLLFVVSGTPNEEINKLVDDRGLRKYFKGVWGTPGSKGFFSKMIIKNFNLKKHEAVFVGDAPNDYIGAEEAGIKFIARIPPGKYNPFDTNAFKIEDKIEDLTFLNNVIQKLI